MGARYYDPVIARFTGVDPIGFDPENVHSFNRYAYANNNPYKFVDRDGKSAILVARAGILGAEGGFVLCGPVCAAIGGGIGVGAALYTGDKALNWTKSQGADNAANPVPGDLIGDQSGDRAGLTKNGKRHTSGPMTPENGGTGDAGKDFDKLTGGNNQPAGGTYPPGTLIGPNGVVLRPGQKGSGPRIDIPGNGSKPPETLHY